MTNYGGDLDGDGLIDADIDTTNIRGEWIVNTIREGSSGHVGDVERPLVTTEPRVGTDAIYVDPNTGSDSVATEDIDSANPLASLQEALDRTPMFLLHEWKIQLVDDGTPTSFTSPTDAFTGPPVYFPTWNISGASPRSAFTIEGNESNPENVVLDVNGFGISLHNSEVDNRGSEAMFNGITFDCDINNKSGEICIDNCVFTGNNTTAAINGKGRGVTYIYDTEFQTGLNHVAHLGQPGAICVIENCTGNVAEYTYWMSNGAKGIIKDSSCIGLKGDYETLSGGQVIGPQSESMGRRRWIGDDFLDNRAFGGRVSNSHYFRPEWSSVQGSPAAGTGLLNLPAGNVTPQEAAVLDMPNIPEDVYFEFRVNNSTPTTGSLRMSFCFDFNTTGEYYRVTHQPDGDAIFQEDVGAGNNNLISGTYTQDTNWHTVHVNRAGNGATDTWELFVDGSSQGTSVDTGIPDRGSNGWRIAFQNQFDQDVDIRNVSVEHFEG